MGSAEIKEKIVIATIECLEKYGRTGTTIRNIAEQAGVNSAAISYYFGGQKNLIILAMHQTLINAFNMSEYSELPSEDVKHFLKTVFIDLIKGAEIWPNVSKAHFYNIYTNNDYNSETTVAVNGFLENIYFKIKDNSTVPENMLRSRMFILMSQVIYFIFSPKLLQDFLPVIDGGKFVNDLVDNLFWE